MTTTAPVSLTPSGTTTKLTTTQKGLKTSSFNADLDSAIFSNANRKTIKKDTKYVSVDMLDNRSDKYNGSGNIRFRASIPIQNVTPNYFDAIIDEVLADTNNKSTLMYILCSLMKSENLLAQYYYNSGSAVLEGVKNIDISSYIDTTGTNNTNPRLVHGWNVNRSWSATNAREILNYHFDTLNQIIHHIIDANLKAPDVEFVNLWSKLFGDISKNTVYTHAVGTLLLPSVINRLAASIGNNAYQAIAFAGYIQSGSKFYPNKGDGSDINSATYWSDVEQTLTLDKLEAYVNINGLIKGSTYNNPMIKSNRSITCVKNMTTSTATPINHRELVFKEDKYKWVTADDIVKKIKFAKQQKGTKTEETVYNETTLKSQTVNLNFNRDSTIVSTTETKSYNTVFTKKRSTKYVYCGWECCPTWDTDYGYDNDSISSKSYTVRRLMSASDILSKSKKDLLKAIENAENAKYIPSSDKSKVPVYTITKVEYVKGSAGEYTADSSTLNTKCYKINQSNFNYCPSGNCTTCTRASGTSRTAAEDGIISQKLNAKPANDPVTLKIYYDVKYYAATQIYNYSGSLGKGIKSVSLTDKSPEKYKGAVCLYNMETDYQCFSDFTFMNWLKIVRSGDYVKKAFEEFLKYIDNHKELILLHKVNKLFGDQIRAKCKDSNMFYATLPVSSLIVSVPNAYTLPYKYYIPSMKIVDVNNSTGHAKPSISELMRGKNVNILNKVECVKDSQNYLDQFMKAIIEGPFVQSTFDKSDVFVLRLPSSGSQLFETVNKNITTMLSNGYVIEHCKINNKSSLLYTGSNAMIVFSFTEFTDTYGALKSKYKLMTTVNVPLLYAEKNATQNTFDIVFNGLDDHAENKCFVYVTNDKNQEIAATMVNKSDSHGIVCQYVSVGYKGADLKTSTCLQLHF